MNGIAFLAIQDIFHIHADQTERYGGSQAVLNEALIESAIMQPQMTFDGMYLQEDIAAMAAAYLFHLSRNQGFVDENKRTGAAAAIVFLKLNDVQLKPPIAGTLEKLVLDVVSGVCSKAEAAKFFRELIIT